MIKAFLAQLAHFLIRLILLTCRIDMRGVKEYVQKAQEEGGILLLWHSGLLLTPYFCGCKTSELSYAAVISNSRDGDLLALIGDSFSNGEALRVAHDSRSKALKTIVNTLKSGKVVIITPDGPQGPPYQVKPGVVFAATMAKKQIFPFTWEATRYWQLGTWDKMRIPKPFSRVTMTVGEPLHLPSGKEKTREELSSHLEDVLNAL